MDAHGHRFEGRKDTQFLPTEDVQESTVKPENKVVKAMSGQDRSSVPRLINPPRPGRSSSEIAKEIMNMPLTVTVKETVNLSPTLRRDLTHASRSTNDTTHQAQETTEKTFLRTCLSQPLPQKSQSYHLAEPRDDLLKVPARVGQARMTGVYDSGSQINVISDRFMHKCGLPVTTEGIEHYKITGVNGGLAHCVGIIPNAEIYITDREFATVGELVVIKHAGFDLLFGRPWITMNRVGTSEEDDGTYLSFRSEGEEYSVNILPRFNYSEKGKEIPVWVNPLSPIRTTCGVAALECTPNPHRPDNPPEQERSPTNEHIEGQEFQEQCELKRESDPEIHTPDTPVPSETCPQAEEPLYPIQRQLQVPLKHKDHHIPTITISSVTPEDCQYHPDPDKQDANQDNEQWPPDDSKADTGSYGQKPLHNLNLTTPLHSSKYTHVLPHLDEWSAFSTPPTTPELEDQSSDNTWESMDRDHQGSMYCHGKSHYHQCDHLGPEEKVYPILSSREMTEIVEWCNKLLEYQQGGYQFIIHQEEAKPIGMTLVSHESPNRQSQRIGEQVLELSRLDSGELYKVVGSQTTSHGRFQHPPQPINKAFTPTPVTEMHIHPQPPEDIQNQDTELPLIPTDIPADLKTEHSTKDPPPSTVYSCFAAILNHNQKPGKEIPAEGEMKGPAGPTPTNPTSNTIPAEPSGVLSNTGESNLKVQAEHDICFPVPKKIWYPPASEKSSNGMLAAQEVTSYAQYDDTNDHEFFAKGVTLVVEDDEGKPAYYRGDATIRISQRSMHSEPKPPNRRRVNHLRKQMFRIGKHIKADQGTRIKDRQTKTPLPPSTARSTAWNSMTPPKLGTVAVAKDTPFLPFKPSSVFSTYHPRHARKPPPQQCSPNSPSSTSSPKQKP